MDISNLERKFRTESLRAGRRRPLALMINRLPGKDEEVQGERIEARAFPSSKEKKIASIWLLIENV